MSNEEFEDLFGNTPFKNIEKINKHIKENYIPKQLIRNKIEEYQNLLTTCNKKEDIERIKGLNERILILKEILGE